MEDFPHDRETLGLEMLEGLGGGHCEGQREWTAFAIIQ